METAEQYKIDSLAGEEMTNEQYHAMTGVSASRIKDYIHDPRLYAYKYLSGEYEQEQKAHFDFGTAAHDICLRGDESGIQVIPSWVLSKSGSKAGNAWKDFAEEHEGELLLKQKEYDAVMRCVEAVQSHPVAGHFLRATGPVEASFWHDDPDLELRVKCRPDKIAMLNARHVVDLKTTATGTQAGRFAKQIGNFGYHIQEHIYRRVLTRLGMEVESFLFIAVDVNPPHTVDVYSLDEEYRRLGATRAENALMELAERHRSNNWDVASSEAVIELAPPNYLKYESEYEL